MNAGPENTLSVDMAADWYEPWQPRIGQRVRVRLNGECPMRYSKRSLEGGGYITMHPPLSHGRYEDGLTGTVYAVVGQAGRYRAVLPTRGHRFVVRFDQRIAPLAKGRAYAAIELEPIEP